MEDALSHEGILVTTAHDIFSAVSRLTATPADAVVISLATLDERDLEVLRFFRERRPPLFVLASFPPERRELAVKALAKGADAYLLEPFYLGEFLDLVRRGLERLPSREVPLDTRPPRAVERELERLSGGVAHAINNPLQILKLLLSDGTVSDAAEFQQEIARIHAVADELLAFSRRGDFAPRADGEVNRAVRKGLEPLHPGLSGVDCTFGELTTLHADESKLAEAFGIYAKLSAIRGPRLPMSVVTSMSAGPPAPGIVVRYTVRELLLSRAEVTGHAEPFTSIFAGEVGLEGTTGSEIIRRHSGTVDLRSAPGDGTVLTVWLPLRRSQPEGDAPRPG
jgi:signal transduction histidine kinase